MRGSGKPLQPKINATANDRAYGDTDNGTTRDIIKGNGNVKDSGDGNKPGHKPLGQRELPAGGPLNRACPAA